MEMEEERERVEEETKRKARGKKQGEVIQNIDEDDDEEYNDGRYFSWLNKP
jgi:hypothetical protein